MSMRTSSSFYVFIFIGYLDECIVIGDGLVHHVVLQKILPCLLKSIVENGNHPTTFYLPPSIHLPLGANSLP